MRFGDSELAKDFSTISTGGIEFRNTNLYSGIDWDGTPTFSDHSTN